MNRLTPPPPACTSVHVEIAAAPPAPKLSPAAPLIIGSALLMQTLDTTVITNALPRMAYSLHEDALHLNVAITSYILAAAVFLPINGWVADRFGAKTVFRLAMVLFAASSLLCGLSHNLPELVGARMLQGMAGAMMAPVGRLVLLRSVPRSDLVRAMVYLTMPALLGPVIGPPIGGFIVTHFSWRWIFYMNVPICIVAVTLVSLFIPEVKEENTGPLDWKGFILTGLGLAGVVYGFENIGRGALPPGLVATLLIGGLACLSVYHWHARRTPHAILDFSVFRYPAFMATTIGGAFLRMAIGAMPFLLAMMLQVAFGMSAFTAGLMTFSSGGAALIMRMSARPILRRFGFKRVLVVNTVISGLTLMGYGLFRPTTPALLIAATLLIGGFFRSLQFTALNALAFVEIPPEKMSRASSLSSVIQQVAQSIGIGLSALVMSGLRSLHRSAALGVNDVTPAFIFLGAMTLVGLVFFLPLKSDVGDDVSGRAPDMDDAQTPGLAAALD